jgi:hypothetical protein
VAYPDRPPPAHTGGFGEPTCRSGHFDAPLNEPGATLELGGLPDAYQPGASYQLTILLSGPGLGSAGFQLSARFSAGSAAGTQAGELRPVDARTTLTTAGSPGVQYLHHTAAGTMPTIADTARWTLEWVAPAEGMIPAGSDAVAFHLVANAADGDESPFGDLIYAAEREIPIYKTRATEAGRQLPAWYTQAADSAVFACTQESRSTRRREAAETRADDRSRG